MQFDRDFDQASDSSPLQFSGIPNFTDLETGVQRESVNCPRSHSSFRRRGGFES